MVRLKKLACNIFFIHIYVSHKGDRIAPTLLLKYMYVFVRNESNINYYRYICIYLRRCGYICGRLVYILDEKDWVGFKVQKLLFFHVCKTRVSKIFYSVVSCVVRSLDVI